VAFRRPLRSNKREDLLKAVSEAFRVYKSWGNVYNFVSTKIRWFDLYLENNRVQPQRHLNQNQIQDTQRPIVTLQHKIEPGVILIAHPREQDPIWSQTVVLILKHNHRGTTGVILNRQVNTEKSVYENLDYDVWYEQDNNEEDDNDEEVGTNFFVNEIDEDQDEEIEEGEYEEDSELTMAEARNEFLELEEEEESTYANSDEVDEIHDLLLKEYKPIYEGGSKRGCVVLHTLKDHDGSQYCADGLYFTTNKEPEKLADLFQRLNSTPQGRNFRIFEGYAGWCEGELEQEIEQRWWFVARCPLHSIFKDNLDHTLPQSLKGHNQIDFSDHGTSGQLWSNILQLMGGEFYHFAHAHVQKTEDINIGTEQS